MRASKFIICLGLLSMPLLVNAGNLKITNDSQLNLSFKINNVCSEQFGSVPKHSTKIIAEKDFNQACQADPKLCVTIVYDKINCRGKKIAEVGFDTSFGVTYIGGGTDDEPLSITGSGFNLTFTSPVK